MLHVNLYSSVCLLLILLVRKNNQRYQTGKQKPEVAEIQTIQRPKDKGQKVQNTTQKNRDCAKRTLLKLGASTFIISKLCYNALRFKKRLIN